MIGKILSFFRAIGLAAVPITVVVVTFLLGVGFRVRSQQIAETQLREQLLTTVSVGAMQFDGDQLKQYVTEADMRKAGFTDIVRRLQRIRDYSPDLRFAYIMRRTNDPENLAFIADADALLTDEELDVNDNGVVDEDEEASMTGDQYPVSHLVTLRTVAFEKPVVDPNITVDQWGTLISSYAPIYDSAGNVVAVLGLDITTDHFAEVTSGSFSIFAVSLMVLVAVFLAAYVVIVIRRRKIQTLKQLDAERTALMDLAMHQLGMPLATFRWWLEILKEKDGGKFCKKGEVCDQLQEGVDRMNDIILGLKRAGELKGSALKQNKKKTKIDSVLKKAISGVQKMYSFKKQKIEFKSKGSLPECLIDENNVLSVFSEVLENASYYSPAKSKVEVEAKKVRSSIEVTITDHGYGIPPEDVPRLFEKFRRGGNAMKYKPAGNGMGLYIAREMIERLGGRIRMASKLNKGTTVTISLPIAK